MSREEFHRAYLRMPAGYRAELIAGVVFEPSPLGWSHGQNHASLIHLIKSYSMHTLGTEVGDNASVFLSDEDEVQPDVVLRIVEELGGRSRLTRKGFVDGPPELVAEVANSSRAVDLHLKRDRCGRAGILEYIVVCLRPKQVYWFDLAGDSELAAGEDGVIRSRIFPGLWIHQDGLLQLDDRLTDEILRLGAC